MKTVKVRICVLISEDGRWDSSGWSGAEDNEMLDTAVDNLQDAVKDRYWLEAELPIRATPTVEATVSKS